MILQMKNKTGLGCEINSAKCINLPVSANQMHNSWIHRKWKRKMKKKKKKKMKKLSIYEQWSSKGEVEGNGILGQR